MWVQAPDNSQHLVSLQVGSPGTGSVADAIFNTTTTTYNDRQLHPVHGYPNIGLCSL